MFVDRNAPGELARKTNPVPEVVLESFMFLNEEPPITIKDNVKIAELINEQPSIIKSFIKLFLSYSEQELIEIANNLNPKAATFFLDVIKENPNFSDKIQFKEALQTKAAQQNKAQPDTLQNATNIDVSELLNFMLSLDNDNDSRCKNINTLDHDTAKALLVELLKTEGGRQLISSSFDLGMSFAKHGDDIKNMVLETVKPSPRIADYTRTNNTLSLAI